MTLTPPKLDDLTWSALAEAARRRIPAESGGAWTLHAPVDPGVTLLELFAYLLEQRLYWLDQVPAPLVLSVLRLLGVAPPAAARSAASVVAFSSGSTDPAIVTVGAGTVVTRDPAERILFTVESDVALVPLEPSATRLLAGGLDRSGDLTARRGVPLLPASREPAEFFLEFRPPANARIARGTRLALLFELDVRGRVAPSWSPEAVAEVPPPAELNWSWVASDQAEIDADVLDGTGGLRRSGVVTVGLPEPSNGYVLRVSTAAATFSAPPVALAVVPNVGVVRHRRSLRAGDAELGDQVARWIRLPGQHLTLPGADGLLVAADLRLRRGGAVQDWHAVPDLTFGGPGDRMVTVDRDAGELVFGDGLTGAIPVPDPVGSPGAPVVEVEYTVGGGVTGNGGMTGNWFLPAPGDRGAVTGRNVVPADGGRDPETIDEARRRAGEELGRVHRAVTAADFAELVETAPGVVTGRAYVGVGEHPGYPGATVPGAVTVRVVPAVRRDDAAVADDAYVARLWPDPGMLAVVRARLGEARLIGTEVFVCPPRYRTVRLRVDLAGQPSDAAEVRALLGPALRRYLDPLIGGDSGSGWPFGGPLRPSGVLRAALAAVGDAAEVVAVAIGLDGAEPGESCADVALRPGELPALESIAIRVGAAEVRR